MFRSQVSPEAHIPLDVQEPEGWFEGSHIRSTQECEAHSELEAHIVPSEQSGEQEGVGMGSQTSLSLQTALEGQSASDLQDEPGAGVGVLVEAGQQTLVVLSQV